MSASTSAPGAGEKVCPFCAETIRAAAVKCRYCGSELTPSTAAGPDPVRVVPAPADTPVDTAPSDAVPGEDGPEPDPRAPGRPSPSAVLSAVLVVALLAVVAVGVLLVHHQRTDDVAPDGQVTSEATRALVMDQAAKLTTTALSYSARTFDKDTARAGRLMTDDMRQRYLKTLDKVRDEVRKRGLVLKADVVASGVVSSTEDSADVLEFVNQTTTAKGVDRRQLDQNRVVVTLTRAGDGGWVIARLQAF